MHLDHLSKLEGTLFDIGLLRLPLSRLGIVQTSLASALAAPSVRTSAIFKQAWLRFALSRLGIIQISLASALAAPELDIALSLALAELTLLYFTLLSWVAGLFLQTRTEIVQGECREKLVFSYSKLQPVMDLSWHKGKIFGHKKAPYINK